MKTPFKSIRAEMTILVLLAGLIVGSIIGFLIYKHTLEKAMEATSERIKTTMAFVKASREYVRKTLRPKVYELLASGCTKEDFILEAQSSSFFTASIFSMVNRDIPNLELRQVAMNPLNPKNKPNDTEMWVIAYMKSRNLKEYEGITVHNGTDYYIKAFAVIPKQSCLRCHGRVEDMPRSVKRIYKPQKDPQWPVGEINGAVMVYVPFEEVIAQARMDGLLNGGIAGGVFIAVSLALIAVLNAKVFKPVEVLKEHVEKISKGELEQKVPYISDNEIGQLARAVERLRISMKKFMEFLG